MERRSTTTRGVVTAGCALAMALAGCALQQKKVEEEIAHPGAIDCRTAPGDLRMLQQEKANVVERIAEGATAIYPGGLVLGLATGLEETKMKVAIGDYNEMIDKRMADIRRTCGL